MNELAENTAKKQRGKPFAKGQSGNPMGKPKGCKNHSTRLALELAQGQLENIMQNLINLALDGDLTAMKLLLDKVLPNSRERALPQLDLSITENTKDLPKLSAEIINAVASGMITPTEGEKLNALLASHAQIIATADFEERLKKLESMDADSK